MLKKLLPLAVIAATLSTTTQAQDDVKVDFYGSARLGFDIVDAGTSDDGANGRDYLTRVGFKASTDLGNGLTGFTQFEYGLRSDLVNFNQMGSPTLRLGMVGIQGDWGKLAFGSQTNIWHSFVRGSYFSDGLDSVRQSSIRDDDLLQYYHKVGNLSFAVGTQFEGQDGDSVDQVQAGIQYVAGPVKLQAAYAKDERGENTGGLLGLRAFWQLNDQVLLSAYTHLADEDYDFYTGSLTGDVRLRDASENGNVNGIPGCRTEERSSSGVYASYRVGDNQFHARYAVDSCDVSGDVDSVKVEYVRYLSKKYRAWVAYEDLSNDEGRKPSTGSDMSELQFGVRLDF